jgi:hydroxypyruvate reductase
MPAFDGRQLVRASFDAALAAADPLGRSAFMAAHLPARPTGRVVVVGGGKAAASMALAVERAWPDVPMTGIVVTRYAHGLATQHIEVVEAGHPVPDDAGERASARMLELVDTLTPDDLLLALISGGGSSLMSTPAPGLTMDNLQALNRALLASGAPITAMNIVRKHCSSIAGGRLAEAAAQRGAAVVALIISDVTGDDPAAIGSGPCTPDPSTYRDALDVVERYRVDLPYAIRIHLERGADGAIAETPKPGDAAFARVTHHVVATAHASLDAAAAFFRAQGITAAVLGDTVTGEAREVAKVYAAMAREVRAHGQPWKAPVALISGGECEVTMPRTLPSTPKNAPRDKHAVKARGGRCTEFLLSLAIELDGMADTYAIACDTDGIDGSEDNAGALLAPDTLARAHAQDLSARRQLDVHDAWGYFDALDDLVVTGPTRTNVNDYRVILVL